MRHVVWDWNGTLFDDLHIVLEAVNHGLAPFTGRLVTLDDYRNHYTRPVKRFYDVFLGRELDEVEWESLDRRFHEGYRDLLDHARLTEDARRALSEVSARGATQSLLSMFPHDELVPLVERMGIAHYFDRIDGLRGTPGDAKAAYLEAHLRDLITGEDPRDVLVVGDTPDDAVAAAHVGASCALVDNGSHHRSALEATGARVVGSLTEAVRVGSF